jgi:hypothetical protein
MQFVQQQPLVLHVVQPDLLQSSRSQVRFLAVLHRILVVGEIHIE